MDPEISVQHATIEDIKRFLEIINNSDDIETQVKLFSVIAYHLVSQGTHREVITTSNIIYDKIYHVLSRCLPRITTIILNFVSALVYDDAGLTTRQSLVQYARNMIRISGSLSLICNLFISCMMHQDTWRALCRCLAEVCRNSHENQIYCSHLIPTGVRRCCNGDTDAALVLQSLLHNQDRNVQLFIGCNGLLIFNRQVLQTSAYLHLLYTVTQNSKGVNMLINNIDLLNIIRDFIKLYGMGSCVGQWSIIILHNVNTHTTGLEINIEKDDNNDDLELHNGKKHNDKPNQKSNMIDSNDSNTTGLLFNIHREFFECKPNKNNNIAFKNSDRKDDTIGIYTKNNDNLIRKLTNSQNMNSVHRSYVNDMPFSYLLKQSFYDSTRESEEKIYNNDNTFSYEGEFGHTKTNNVNMHKEYIDKTNYKSRSNLYKYNNIVNEDLSILEFKPTIVSTPKISFRVKTNASHLLMTELKRMKDSHKQNRRRRRNIKPKNIENDIKHRTISGRLFSVINDSCTTFVKTVKNIFKSKKYPDVVKHKEDKPSGNHFCTEKEACSYSFTNYMRLRDAILDNKTDSNNNTVRSINSDNTSNKSCETCNDTFVLKDKLVNDQNLRHTLKKLKLGINLYGCDFRKISTALWPRERYMTPEVLYNLYRKLILK
ncbi:probable cyclin-dependent serine/threonine-protein kinase DDB_G0292550 [Achroia grisella]|uniref:probable cyclin-dependent serine/threonine-protein kinase DDB_G0292550 n=1 Tax=Achroia grisella TaxID=688607 RepID=UPI0027D262CF|nr:probable cyclin-dependent serine/threonine-protein kinase DDB_G0292550 [Achroia grisella]